jgi:hypothetical protein
MTDGIAIILEMEEKIKLNKWDLELRYVLYYGKIDTMINNVRAFEMLGSGLTKARETLIDVKKNDVRYYISGESDKIQYAQINLAFRIYQDYIDTWKEKDLKTIELFLAEMDYKEVASRIKVEASSAWRKRKSLKIEEYQNIKKIILFLAGLK